MGQTLTGGNTNNLPPLLICPSNIYLDCPGANIPTANVAAVVVIGIEDGWTQKVVDGIKATGKPVVGFGIEQHGDHDTIMRASKAAREFVQWASEKQREACPIHELWVSTKCGESDTTSGLSLIHISEPTRPY